MERNIAATAPKGPAVKLQGLGAPIASVRHSGETVNAFIRAAVRAEIERRRAAVAADLADLDAADWRLLLGVVS